MSQNCRYLIYVKTRNWMALKFMPGFSQHQGVYLYYEKPGRTYSKYPDSIKLYRKFTQFITAK